MKADGSASPVSFARASSMPIKKADDDLQIVWGEVYAPVEEVGVDSQKDFATAETIREMAYGFMRKMELGAIDTQHSREDNGAYIVESFIARKGDPDFIEGAWVLGVKCPDDVWELVKSGDLNGFSMDGEGIRVESVVELTIPDILTGETMPAADGHFHMFFVKYDNEGNFLGGETSAAPDGHFHKIMRGTVTEDAEGHNHRFSFVEGVLSAEIAN